MGAKNIYIDEIKNYAELAQEAYKDYKNGDKFPPEKETFIVKDVLNDPETGIYAFLAEDNKGNKYIVFRGTENGQDLSSDIDILMGKAPKQLKVAQKWINDLRNNGLISKSDFSKRSVTYQTKILLN